MTCYSTAGRRPSDVQHRRHQPEDVAVEHIATKIALASLISAITRTDTPEALERWASQSPVPLPRWDKDEELTERIGERAEMIEIGMLDLIGRHFLDRAERLAHSRS